MSEQQMERDEIKLYVDAHYISTSEAFARLMGWDTHKVCSNFQNNTSYIAFADAVFVGISTNDAAASAP
jgi:hypothetical protein